MCFWQSRDLKISSSTLWKDFRLIKRVISYMLRFLDGARKRKISKSPYPTAKELKWSFYKLVEVIQKEMLSEEICKIQKYLEFYKGLHHLYRTSRKIEEFFHYSG